MSQTPNTQQKNSSKKFVVLALALALLGGGGFFAVKKGYVTLGSNSKSGDSDRSTASTEATTPLSAEVTSKGLGAKKDAGTHATAELGADTGAHSLSPTGPAKALPSGEGCFEVSYAHAKMASHSDGELCAEHKNKITLDVKGLNPKSVCLRVNGNPVHAQVMAKKGQPTVVLFDSVAGPKSVVTARYCTGKVTCGLDCKVSKDEFLDALGGGADDTFMTGAAAWDSTKKDARATKTEVELEKELKDFQGEFAGKDGAHEKFFAGWQETDRKEACEGRRVASVHKK